MDSVKTRRMTITINTKPTRLSEALQNAGAVVSSMMLTVAGQKMRYVIRVIKKVIYPHTVKMSKTSAVKEMPVKAKVQEKAKTKAKEKVKVIVEQIKLIRKKLIKLVNSVGSITNTVNHVRFGTQSSQRLRKQ